MTNSPHYTQLDAMDCGPTCLKIIAQHYGRNYSLQNLRDKCHITREWISWLQSHSIEGSKGVVLILEHIPEFYKSKGMNISGCKF